MSVRYKVSDNWFQNKISELENAKQLGKLSTRDYLQAVGVYSIMAGKIVEREEFINDGAKWKVENMRKVDGSKYALPSAKNSISRLFSDGYEVNTGDIEKVIISIVANPPFEKVA